MEVELSQPELLLPLMEALRSLDCSCTRIARNRCAVYHRTAADAHEAWIELTFFLRAWQSQHEPLELQLSY
jgi:hypothetical protein